MSIALYRRYRPETFADVIGQEHVTEPLMQALRSERVSHAYLFSGPRGCGKTTSARILARCLNCEQGPTPEPCGTCESCVALARDGAGSVDVIEIDAASHGRVDDTRELRERAAFGPATARYKIYIIDEAHMVSREGFNSLLKVVEEPPPHVKFIFATTEPEKVLATIRSRTHHYPFHLVPPQRLTAYLEQLCRTEGVHLEPGVLSFVTRAGGGSVRDSLSVLDQLISGAGEDGLTYERTAALLGFTDVELLDAVVEAVAAGDAATVFAQVDRVMESGHDPRRFVEDLLERYRDLIVLAAVGEQAGGLLPGLPADQVERMRRQAQAYGAAGLSRAGDLVSQGLSEMTGAVSYRLVLELLAARLLLPAAQGEEGHGARLDRIERRLGAADHPGDGVAAGRRGGPSPVEEGPPGAAGGGPGASTGGQGVPAQPSARQRAVAQARATDGESAPTAPAPAPVDGEQARGAGQGQVEEQGRGQQVDGPRPDPGAQAPGHLDTAALRRHWPEIIAAVRSISRRTAGALESIQVVDFDGRRLLVGMPDERWIRHFMGTSNEEALRQGVLDALALDTRIEATVVGGHPPADGGGGGRAGSGSSPSAPPTAAAEAAGSHHRSGNRPRQPAARPGGGPAPGPGGQAAPEPPDDEPERAPQQPPGPAPQQPSGPEPEEPPEPDDWAPPEDLGPPDVATPASPRTDTSGVPSARTPAVPEGIPDAPMRGRLRTRGASGDGGATAAAAPSAAAAPVRVRGRGGADPAPGQPRRGAGAGEPGLAEQLGAGGRPDGPAPDQPDWSRRTAGQGAPAWATGAEPAPDGPPATGDRPATAPAHPADADPSDDDEDLATSGTVGQPVIESVLGGTVIAINDDPVA
ncbi:DNA polymerase III subunit gamma and tau [uncultured Serinicoccus sp.]|uniref:DNA polymerase III subunit gamma and tau n=1 Tax=uncultured Serinicoccus sp. TaxID=735514 RepID=UPI002602A371|nr:DNA polymerase III subunit gamma and tau [uncultured Serinicoccus sp.]